MSNKTEFPLAAEALKRDLEQAGRLSGISSCCNSTTHVNFDQSNSRHITCAKCNEDCIDLENKRSSTIQALQSELSRLEGGGCDEDSLMSLVEWIVEMRLSPDGFGGLSNPKTYNANYFGTSPKDIVRCYLSVNPKTK